MKKIFNTPEMTISAFSLESIVLASGNTPASKSAAEKAMAGLSEHGVSDVISLKAIITP